MIPAKSLPAGWPTDKPLAISVSVMLEGWTDDSAPGIGPMGNPLRRRRARPAGPLVGGLRAEGRRLAPPRHPGSSQKLRAVFYVSGILAERYPELMRAIAGAGHVVAAHGWGQNIIPSYQTAEEEAHDLARCIERHRRERGQPPPGWLSPRCTPSERTSALLAKAGFTWHADFFDSDLPYRHKTSSGDDRGRALHHGGERHAALYPLRRRARGLHAHPRTHRRQLAAARPARRLSRHHGSCACLRPADGRDRVHEFAGAGEALRRVGMAHRSPRAWPT